MSDDFDPVTRTASSQPKLGQRSRPAYQHFCHYCANHTEPQTAYSLVVSSAGTAHYEGDPGSTLCGLDTQEMNR